MSYLLGLYIILVNFTKNHQTVKLCLGVGWFLVKIFNINYNS